MAEALVDPDVDHRADGHRFRRDIEGLRAVAVIVVVLFHADVAALAGGFIGVDVFFVISGFLITSLLLREIGRTGSISPARFYARRVRRLLPASVLVLVVTTIVSWFVLPPLTFVVAAKDLPYAAVFLANLRFSQRTFDYFAGHLPSTVTHYWSLAVEEQFYVVWPLVLLAAARLGRRRAVGITLALITVSSFAVCVLLTDRRVAWAFYFLPARAWELAVGGLLAVGAGQVARLGRWTREVLGVAGLAAIAAAALVFDATTHFPGVAAALPVAGAAMLIAAGMHAGGSVVSRALSFRPLVVLGGWSYSLYLWHYPLLLFVRGDGRHPPSATARGLAIVLAVGLAAATFRIIEAPIRSFRALVAAPWRTIGLGVALTGFALVVGLAAASLQPALDAGRVAGPSAPGLLDYVPSNLQPPLDHAGALPSIYADGCDNNSNLDVARLLGQSCLYGDPAGHRVVVLFGDSHASHWFPAFDTVARERGWQLRVITKVACRSVDSPRTRRAAGAVATCDAWREEAIAQIAELDHPVVVLSNSRGNTSKAQAAADLTDTVRRLDAQVVVLGDVPRPGFDVPLCLSAHLHDARSCAPTRHEAVDEGRRRLDRAAADEAGASYVDPTDRVCPGSRCPVIAGNLLVYRDGDHLGTPYAASLAGWLGQALPPSL